MSQQPYYTPPPAVPPTSGMAIGSLIASILGLTLFPTIGSIIGLILGYMARSQIRDSRQTMSGEGLATAGIILGWIGIALAVIGICLMILVWAGLLGVPFGLTICAGLGNTY
ncbi:MAG: DUF4190 domain-containing protein [Anaerolineae bacterium]